jgi:hypothetical protein
MENLKIGDKVEVMDAGLAMLNATMERITGKKQKPNNYGVVSEIEDGGKTILVEFPIGDDDPEEHSQVAPYPSHQVKLRK